MNNDEREVAKASYIINLLNEIEQLLEYTSAYLNILINISAKYGDNTTSISTEETNNLDRIVNILRSLAFKIVTRIETIIKKIEMTNKDKKILENIKKKYEIIENSMYFEFKDIKEFTQAVNDLFINNISLNEMVRSSKEVIEGLSK